MTCLVIVLILLSGSMASCAHHARPKTGGPTPCNNLCSEGCDRLCGTPQFSRCCIGLYTKRSIPEAQSERKLGYPFRLGTRLPPGLTA
ncbi:hypothetical protein BV898_17414 [Hypsibius exemplaris]|uniref:Uncharacterized protein n=1 Tax=Hypsibius exemplaris TaxID=2072580 RepID=A0A9X6NM73_HYPEX|nr:hypothetical protein BV898_17414 [Hypsibius exemplaris]